MGAKGMKRYAKIHLDREDKSNQDILRYDGGIYEIAKEENNTGTYLVLDEKERRILGLNIFYLYENEFTEISPFEAGIRNLLEDDPQ